MKNLSQNEMARYIDHTILKADASKEQVIAICEESKKYQFASVCVNPNWIALVASELKGTNVSPCCVIAFPLGATTPEAKAAETRLAVAAGALEVDMVINIGAVKSGDWNLVKSDIAAVVASKGESKVKVIIEACLLTDEEKVKVCQISREIGADFVKTSTGFSIGGATVKDVTLMRETVGQQMGVKASGGIHTLEEAEQMIAAGASRIGTSASIKIVEALA